MALTRGWLPILIILLTCSRYGNSFQPPSRKITIIDGQSAAYRTSGDTLWLTGIQVGDTLAFSFKVRPGTGFGWDLIHQHSLERLYRKTRDSVNARGQNAWRLYNFGFTVLKPESLMLDFAFRRSETESPLRQCIVLPR